MVFNSNPIGNSKEILKRKLGGELFAPQTLADAAFTDGVCKAGNPIAADGTVANGATAIGILVNDVYKENPNGTLLKAFGVVNSANAPVVYDEGVKTALNLVVFE